MYAFSTAMDDPVQDIVNRSAGVLRCDPALLNYRKGGASAAVSEENSSGSSSGEGAECVGHIVRDVSPKKVMVCLSFVLPREVSRHC